jgi:serine protease Do
VADIQNKGTHMLREILATLKARPTATLAFAGVFGVLGVVIGAVVNWNATSAKPALSCDGEYADSLQMRESEPRLPTPKPAEYTYLVRNTARYECPYFGPDGKLRRRVDQAREHGTAFAYEVVGGETYLLTNEHVAVWPEVTDARNKVSGVAEGCKRVEARLRIVNDERDEEEVGQIPVKLVAADARLDAAVLKASQTLSVLPYRIGRSAALRQGNAVEVRGFPLGLLHAVNTGKVVNPYDHDVEQGWDHVDFVVDALLSEGNSGSPVLALSCATGKLELVGMYHAGYKDASALNVVVGIDQVREFMSKKRRIPRASVDGPSLTAAERRRLEERLDSGTLPIFHFGGLTVLVEKRDEQLRYHLYGRGFPLDDRRVAVMVDRPSPKGFGELDGLVVRGEGAWRASSLKTLGEDDRDLLGRAADALRLHVLKVLEYRRLLESGDTLDDRRHAREIRKGLERQTMPERELAGSLLDLIERLAPARDTPVPSTVGADAAVPPPPTLTPEPTPTPL